jgi:hypothetical protein
VQKLSLSSLWSLGKYGTGDGAVTDFVACRPRPSSRDNFRDRTTFVKEIQL